MKKTLLSLFTVISFTIYSQSLQMIDQASNVIAPNGTIYVVTTASQTTQRIIDIKNISGSTKSYDVKRYDVLLNTAGSTTAVAYFCFAGQCYTSAMDSAGTAVLNAGQSASQLQGTFNMLVSDLDEASSVGLSIVKYTFFNIASPADSTQFTFAYNHPSPTTGIKQINNILSSFELSPNPVNEIANIKINSVNAINAKLSIYNALGAVVYEKPISLTEGKNKIEFNTENLPSGIYFANMKTNTSSVTKKFIVN